MLRFVLLATVVVAWKTSINVVGILKCSSPQQNKAAVLLIEKDCSDCMWPLNEIDPDDEIFSGTYDHNELFDIEGTANEWGDIELYLRVISNCRNGWQEKSFDLTSGRGLSQGGAGLSFKTCEDRNKLAGDYHHFPSNFIADINFNVSIDLDRTTIQSKHYVYECS